MIHNSCDLLCVHALITVERLASTWRSNDTEVLTMTIPEDCTEFSTYYDSLQNKISHITILDELLAGTYVNGGCHSLHAHI